MIAVNLMPTAVRLRQTCRRHLRRWLAVVACSAVVGAVPVSMELVQRHQLGNLKQEQTALGQEMASTQEALQLAGANTRKYADQIVQANALRTKRSWAGMLNMIGQAMPQRVWLSSLSTKPPSPGAPRAGGEQRHRNTPLNSNDPPENRQVMLKGPRDLEILGYAVDHADLYAFMTALKEWGSFLEVELTSSGSEPTLRGQAVRFTLDCRW
ncbi:MAG: PilN domain-containing protein [Planctomycetes bacterium]|nr:PilN domain-containing protein [Planctomycetota bacterium]